MNVSFFYSTPVSWQIFWMRLNLVCESICQNGNAALGGMACRYGSVNGLNQKTESLNRWKEGAEQVETEKKKHGRWRMERKRTMCACSLSEGGWNDERNNERNIIVLLLSVKSP